MAAAPTTASVESRRFVGVSISSGGQKSRSPSDLGFSQPSRFLSGQNRNEVHLTMARIEPLQLPHRTSRCFFVLAKPPRHPSQQTQVVGAHSRMLNSCSTKCPGEIPLPVAQAAAGLFSRTTL